LARLSHLVEQQDPIRFAKRPPTYPEIGEAAYGRAGKTMVWFGMIAMTLGVCGSYQVFSGKLIAALVGPTSVIGLRWMTQTRCVLLTTPLLFCMSLVPDLGALRWTSVVGLFSVFAACVVVLVDCAVRSDVVFRPVMQYPMIEVETFPMFMGNAAYLYLISTAVLPLEQQMRNREDFGSALSWSQVAITIANVLFALFAYMAYDTVEGGVKQNVVDNLSPGPATSLVQAFVAVNQLFTYTLFSWPMAQALERAIAENGARTGKGLAFGAGLSFVGSWNESGVNRADGEMDAGLATVGPRLLEREEVLAVASESADLLDLEAEKQTLSSGCRAALRATLVASTTAVAIGVPQFGVLSSLTGAFGNNFLAFVFVPVLFFTLFRADGKKIGVAKGALLATLFMFGIGMLVLTTRSSFEMIK
jgi:hypothetical protein